MAQLVRVLLNPEHALPYGTDILLGGDVILSVNEIQITAAASVIAGEVER